MIRLTDLLAAEVRLTDGTAGGRVVDAVIRLRQPDLLDAAGPGPGPGHGDRAGTGNRDEDGSADRGLTSVHPELTALLVRSTDRTSALVAWERVLATGLDEIDGHGPRVTLGVDRAQLQPVDLDTGSGPGELRLVRDVLDTQIFDVDGRRMARVADILLAPTGDGGLRATAVDVGFGAVCRRVGLRRLGVRLGEEVVDWRALHLTSARGHRVALATTRTAVHHLEVDELAQLLTDVSTEVGLGVIEAVGPSRTAAAVSLADPTVGDRLLVRTSDEAVAPILAELAPVHAHRIEGLRRRGGRPRPRFRRHRAWRRRLPTSGPDDRGSG